VRKIRTLNVDEIDGKSVLTLRLKSKQRVQIERKTANTEQRQIHSRSKISHTATS